MTNAIQILPHHQSAPLLSAYDHARSAKRRRVFLGAILFVGCVLVSGIAGEVRPAKLFGDFPKFFDYIGRLFFLDTGASVFSDPAEWFWGITQKNKWLPLLLETLLVAYIGTVIGFIFAFALSFVAARNMSCPLWLRLSVKRFLEFCRTVPELVFALIFVVAFGLGPLPGVLALAIHSTGALGKLFSEIIENIDMKPVEGLQAAGASWIKTVRFAAVPQILSSFASYGLLRFEINVREAGIMGFVGAGGIGDELLVSIRKFYYSDVSAIILLIVITVIIIDILTERLRHRLTAMEGAK